MRALFLTALLSRLVVDAIGQGTVQFQNIQQGGPNAPVFQSDGVTKCAGPQFMAELLVGTSVNTLNSIATTGFLSGIGAGHFYG
jgi:hypothetical protein